SSGASSPTASGGPRSWVSRWSAMATRSPATTAADGPRRASDLLRCVGAEVVRMAAEPDSSLSLRSNRANASPRHVAHTHPAIPVARRDTTMRTIFSIALLCATVASAAPSAAQPAPLDRLLGQLYDLRAARASNASHGKISSRLLPPPT